MPIQINTLHKNLRYLWNLLMNSGTSVVDQLSNPPPEARPAPLLSAPTKTSAIPTRSKPISELQNARMPEKRPIESTIAQRTTQPLPSQVTKELQTPWSSPASSDNSTAIPPRVAAPNFSGKRQLPVLPSENIRSPEEAQFNPEIAKLLRELNQLTQQQVAIAERSNRSLTELEKSSAPLTYR